MNSVNLIGRLTRDPELSYTQNGTAYCRFTLAIDKNLNKDKKKEMVGKGLPTADFINIVVWNKSAENCANYLAKGRLVAVQGRIQTGSYQAEDGTKRYTTDVVASNVQFLEWGNKSNQQSEPGQDDFDIDGFSPVDEDNIPF